MSARGRARQGGSERAAEAFGQGVDPSTGDQPLIAPGAYDEDDEGSDGSLGNLGASGEGEGGDDSAAVAGAVECSNCARMDGKLAVSRAANRKNRQGFRRWKKRAEKRLQRVAELEGQIRLANWRKEGGRQLTEVGGCHQIGRAHV